MMSEHKNLLLVFSLILCVGAGPISKWDQELPNFEGITERSIYDVERCLIDMSDRGSPIVYTQPDRPKVRTLIWIEKRLDRASARVTLEEIAGGTHIKSWVRWSQVKDCAPLRQP